MDTIRQIYLQHKKEIDYPKNPLQRSSEALALVEKSGIIEV